MPVLYCGEKDFIEIKVPRAATAMFCNRLVTVRGVRRGGRGTELLIRSVGPDDQFERVVDYPSGDLRRIDVKIQRAIDAVAETLRSRWLLKQPPLEARKRYVCQDQPRNALAVATVA